MNLNGAIFKQISFESVTALHKEKYLCLSFLVNSSKDLDKTRRFETYCT